MRMIPISGRDPLSRISRQVGNRILTHVDDRQAEDKGHRQTRDNDYSPFRYRVTLSKMRVEVVLIRITREKSEPGRVSLRNGSPEWMLVRRANFKVFKKTAQLGRNYFTHWYSKPLVLIIRRRCACATDPPCDS